MGEDLKDTVTPSDAPKAQHRYAVNAIRSLEGRIAEMGDALLFLQKKWPRPVTSEEQEAHLIDVANAEHVIRTLGTAIRGLAAHEEHARIRVETPVVNYNGVDTIQFYATAAAAQGAEYKWLFYKHEGSTNPRKVPVRDGVGHRPGEPAYPSMSLEAAQAAVAKLLQEFITYDARYNE